LTGTVKRPPVNENKPYDKFWIIDGEDGVVHWVESVEKVEEIEGQKQEGLLPCPRCEAKAIETTQCRQDPTTMIDCTKIYYGVRCTECPIEIPINYDREQAHKIWNERIKRKVIDCVKP